MSRSTPDPLFAAAARIEIERRVRASASAAKPRRAWAMELGAIAGVAVVVAGVAVGVSALRPALDTGSGPAGSVTQSASPTGDPAPLVTGPSTQAPTGPPTEAPTSAPPVATAPPTRTPTTPTAPPTSSAPTTAPPAATSALIGPTGAKVRSSAEIRAWARSIGNDSIWADQAVIVTTCMAEHGFLYDVEYNYRAGLAAQHVGLTDAQYEAFDAAHWGPKTGLPYTWQTAGCDGLAVHLTGQDDAN